VRIIRSRSRTNRDSAAQTAGCARARETAFDAIVVRRTLIPLWPLAAPKEDRVVAVCVKFDAAAKGAGRAGAVGRDWSLYSTDPRD